MSVEGVSEGRCRSSRNLNVKCLRWQKIKRVKLERVQRTGGAFVRGGEESSNKEASTMMMLAKQGKGKQEAKESGAAR